MPGEREIYGGDCVFFSDIENPRCRYFQEAVLPLNKELRGIFSSETLAIQIRDDPSPTCYSAESRFGG